MKKELLTQFMKKRIVELKKEQHNGTTHVYQSTLNRLKNFINGCEITFNQLTPEQLVLFEQKLLVDQLKWNTISTYIHMLRSVCNQALKRGMVAYVPRLFNKIHIGTDCPVKRAIPPEAICRLMTDRKPLPRKLAFDRSLPTLLFLLRGMPFMGLTSLRRCNLQGNVITYHRHKTSRKLTVVVGEKAVEIIQEYMHTNPDSPYLLPIIWNPGKGEYGQYARMLRLQNCRLTRVAHILGIRDRLSIYTARHTWATTVLRQNCNSGLIRDTMGHSSIKVTEVYFQPYRDDEINQMNSSLITYILSRKKKGADKNLRS